MPDFDALRKSLIENDEEFRRWSQEHRSYESRLAELAGKKGALGRGGAAVHDVAGDAGLKHTHHLLRSNERRVHLLRRALEHDAAVAHDVEAAGDVEGDVQLLLHQQHRGPREGTEQKLSQAYAPPNRSDQGIGHGHLASMLGHPAVHPGFAEHTVLVPQHRPKLNLLSTFMRQK